MPAAFAVRVANDLMINKAVHLIHRIHAKDFIQASINTKKTKGGLH